MKISVEQKLLNANDTVALENRGDFDTNGIFVVNVMASPGAGKTSTILATIDKLANWQDLHTVRPGVIEGDVASRIDADTIAARGVPVVQINTGGSCHLDAPMVRTSLDALPLDSIDMLFIENVGNLICPAEFALGEDLSVVIASVPEGHDKPYKYPGMFAKTDAVILNKVDVIDVFNFDVGYFQRGIHMVNTNAPMFLVSCTTGEGVDAWVTWLLEQRSA